MGAGWVGWRTRCSEGDKVDDVSGLRLIAVQIVTKMSTEAFWLVQWAAVAATASEVMRHQNQPPSHQGQQSERRGQVSARFVYYHCLLDSWTLVFRMITATTMPSDSIVAAGRSFDGFVDAGVIGLLPWK